MSILSEFRDNFEVMENIMDVCRIVNVCNILHVLRVIHIFLHVISCNIYVRKHVITCEDKLHVKQAKVPSTHGCKLCNHGCSFDPRGGRGLVGWSGDSRYCSVRTYRGCNHNPVG